MQPPDDRRWRIWRASPGRAMSGPGVILAIETSAAACSAALWRDGGIVAHRFRAMARGHAEALMPMVVETLAEAGTRFDALDAVAVTVGPGAFTGLRIGLAAARGIALAAGIPVIGASSFAVVAEAVGPAEARGRHVAVLIDSQRGDLFLQLFTPDLSPVGEPAILAPAVVPGYLPSGPLLLAGDGVGLLRPVLATLGRPGTAMSVVEGPPDAASTARLAARLLRQGGGLPPVPLYLRPPEVRLPGSPRAASGGPVGTGPQGME